ncbi:MAG: MIP family channel protein [Acidobacteriota bacterium]|nr:MIP family channel protein [Acidobacteriota bacterium]
MQEPSLVRRSLAELIGTYCLVLAGCGAVVADAGGAGLGTVGISLTFGLVVTVMVLSIGHVSGAHINPAVTLAFALFRHFPRRDVPAYLVAQILGASGAAATLAAVFGPQGTLGATLPAGAPGASLLLEVLLTAILMFVITSVATDTRAVGQMAGLAIGATVAVGALWGGSTSGASMNPARSFGPALVSGAWADHWLYWLGPIVGAFLGAAVYGFLRGGPSDSS